MNVFHGDGIWELGDFRTEIRKNGTLICLLLGLCFFSAGVYAADSDTLTVKGPGNTSFVFKKIRVGGGLGPLDGQSFVMGDASGDFRTPPTGMVIGGDFKDSQSRYFYMGAYEITQGQYKAVTGEDIKGAGDDYPVTGISWFQVMNFIDKLNRYIYEHEMSSLPVSGPFPGFLRLPTEGEWEFAARGGVSVDSTVFDKDYPYDEDEELAAYEWFSGPSSSHNKIQKVGKLKPNPLGLYDMLGNVQEMTSSLYHIEYYQGRSGGFTARGGHYLTEEDDITAFRRSEEPFYLGTVEKDMRPNVKPTMGFRLVFGSPVLTDNKAISDIEKAWAKHRKGAGSKMPAAVSVSDTETKESVSSDEALRRLDSISTALEKAGLKTSLQKELDGTRAALIDIARIRRKADEDSAKVWVKIACERGMYMSMNLQALQVVRESNSELLQKRAEQYEYNINSGIENYSEIMGELVKLPKEVVLEGFDHYTRRMQGKLNVEKHSQDRKAQERINDLTAQIAKIAITKNHYLSYEKEKRSNASGWKKDYLK